MTKTNSREIDNMNRPITNNMMTLVTKNFPQRKAQDQMAPPLSTTKYSKKNSYKYFTNSSKN